MSEMDLGLGFIVGLVVGAYGAWLGRDWIQMGVTLMTLQKAENKRIDAEELKAKKEEQYHFSVKEAEAKQLEIDKGVKASRDSNTSANPLSEEQTTPHPPLKQNH